MKKLYWMTLFFVLTLGSVVGGISAGAAKQTEEKKQKQVTSVTVEYGDTLWKIAQKYYSGECGTMQEYVDELIRCNRLPDDSITAGKKLIIPYYTVEGAE